MQDGESYQNQFLNYMKNTFQMKYCPESTLGETKTLTRKPKICDCQASIGTKNLSTLMMDQGGDADRALNATKNRSQNVISDTYRPKNDGNYLYQRHLHYRHNETAPTIPLNIGTTLDGRYQAETVGTTNTALDGDRRNCFETESFLGGANCSEGSVKSLKSAKTVVSRRSSHDLRKMVKSQCKLHEAIDETLKQMDSADDDIGKHLKATHCGLNEPSTMDFPLDQCKRCIDVVHPSLSIQKNVMTEIGKGDFIESRNTDTLTITVDDVVNTKVINPMIRKLQRMYLNNMKDEMSLMEDLERLPHQVNEVYKATIFKQQKD